MSNIIKDLIKCIQRLSDSCIDTPTRKGLLRQCEQELSVMTARVQAASGSIPTYDKRNYMKVLLAYSKS